MYGKTVTVALMILLLALLLVKGVQTMNTVHERVSTKLGALGQVIPQEAK